MGYRTFRRKSRHIGVGTLCALIHKRESVLKAEHAPQKGGYEPSACGSLILGASRMPRHNADPPSGDSFGRQTANGNISELRAANTSMA